MIKVSKKNTIRLLKLCFWLGAITDGLAVIPMLCPAVGIALFGGDAMRVNPEYRFAMGFGGSLMAGWTVLLLWGAGKPLERRGLLLITLFPVIAGIVATTIYGAAAGVISLKSVIPLWIHLGVICALFLSGYFIAGAINGGKDKLGGEAES